MNAILTRRWRQIEMVYCLLSAGIYLDREQPSTSLVTLSRSARNHIV